MTRTLYQATALGAPLVAAPLAGETECSWSEQLDRLSDAAALGKETNVTLALRNAAQTFAATAHDCKRAAKETDSCMAAIRPRSRRARRDERPARTRLPMPCCRLERCERADGAGRRCDRRCVRLIPRFRRTRQCRTAGKGRGGTRARALASRSLPPERKRTQPQIASGVRGDRTCVLAGGCGPGRRASRRKAQAESVVSGADAPYCFISRFGTIVRCALSAVEPYYRNTARQCAWLVRGEIRSQPVARRPGSLLLLHFFRQNEVLKITSCDGQKKVGAFPSPPPQPRGT